MLNVVSMFSADVMLQFTSMKKEYSQWHRLKKTLNERNKLPTFKVREIWWCSIGLNVGDEEDGKNRQYERPVLIMRKFNRYLFWGVPTSLQIKNSPYYHSISLHGRTQSVLLSQFRLWDSRRLSNKIGTLSVNQFDGVRDALKALL